MAKGAGRLFVLKKAAAVIGGGRTLSMTVNGEAIDVSDKDSNGVIEYLAGVQTNRQVVMAVEGVEEDQVLRAIALGAQGASFLSDITFDFHDGGELSGDWFFSGYTESGEFNGEVTYTGTFSSDGAWTYTP